MRVIAGKYRSRPLRSLRGMDIRPTSDRLRETLFNVLTAGNPAALEGSVWLDLFAGTGAVGIEALSRGAKQVYFVENSAAGGGCDPRESAEPGHCATASSFCRKNCRARSGAWSGNMWRPTWCSSIRLIACRMLTRNALRALADSSLVWAMSVVIAEHEKKFDPGEEFGPLRRFRKLAQGSAAFSFYRMGSAGDLRV